MNYHQRMYLPMAARLLFFAALYGIGMVMGSCVTRADLTAECRDTGIVTLADGQHYCK